ncbi:MAG TPA: ATP-binding protein, partial [Holophagaceae bacterium]|nr:ATP-binding protein [Holophagaceae bacterium]
FDQESANQYQVVLEGYDKDWAPWTLEAQKEYTNLHEGRYRFRVRARNIYGEVGREAAYAFRVLPPWFRRWWAYLIYLGLASYGITLVFKARTRLLRERNINLHARIAEATMELYEREQQLERMNRDLQELNEQKNQYLGIVAHDLRNPLHGILLTAEMIEESSSLEEVRQLAGRISGVGDDMASLINRFLDIAAIDSGNIRPELERFSLKALVEEAVESFLERARRKGIELRTDVPEGPSDVVADPKFMKSVLDNLVSNALKFSPSGRVVELRLDAEGGKVILSVIDQGPGLSADDKARLFQRFTRLSARPTGGEGSVGLGLSIIKHMVDAMGGRIWVESEEGQGATFRVELPAPLPE